MPVLMMLSREVRRVPLDYEHPKRERYDFRAMRYVESYQPVLDRFYVPAARQWLAEWDLWQKGEHPDQVKHATEPERVACSFEEWHDDGPNPDFYYPGEKWPDGVEMGICMYESVTEGTPISAVYPDTADGRVAMAQEVVKSEHGITTGLGVQDWLGVITDQIHAKDISTGELS